MEKKHSYEVNLLLLLLHSAFQKVIIAFLHTSITLDIADYERSRACTFFNGNNNLCFYRVQLLVLPHSYLWQSISTQGGGQVISESHTITHIISSLMIT